MNRCLVIAVLALLAVAGRVPPVLAATGAGALARPVGSKPCTGGVLNSQFWTVQAGDTITCQIIGAKDARTTSGATVPVLIKSDLSLLGEVTVAGTLTGTPGTSRATVSFTWPYSMGPACATVHVAYWGGASTGFLFCNSATIAGKNTRAGWAIVDPSCNLVLTNPLTGRCYPPLGSVQGPSGLRDCTSEETKYESFSFSPGGIVGGQPPYTVTASATNSVTLAPASGYADITLASNDLPFSGTFPVGQTTVTITVADAVGASVQCSFTVTIVRVSVTVADAAICAGSATTLTAQPSGGSGPYSFAWSGPGGFTATGQTISVSGAGQYTVTVTDSSGCQGQGSGTLTVNQAPSVSISGQTNVSCRGGSDGSATVTVTGGTSPYTVSDGTSSQTGAGPFTFSGLAANTYHYAVTDASGCTASTSVTLTQPAPLTVSTTQTNVSCFGESNGSATAQASGGTGPYSYSWDTDLVQTGATATGLAHGPYTVTVTDKNGCTATATVRITQPERLLLGIFGSPAVSCHGGSDGSATVEIEGGTAPYSWSWNTTPAQTGTGPEATATGLAAGEYTVTVTDKNGCTASRSVTITQPAPFTVSTTQTNLSCSGESNGSATATAAGGTGPYSYLWSNGATGVTADNLTAGSYTVTVIDKNGCTATATVTITQPTTSLTVSTTQTNVSSNGGSNGSATAAAAGGTAPYTYSWNTNPVQTNATATGLAAGSYTVTVTDARGCTATATVTITQPAPLMVSATKTDISCYDAKDGSVTLTVTGGTPPYTARDSFADSTPQTGMGPFVFTTDHGPGLWNYSVTDANGSRAIVEVMITQPDPLTVSPALANHNRCFGETEGRLKADISGGTAPYTWSWNTSPAQTGAGATATATGLAAGTYTVTVTDKNGCTASTSMTINQPPPLRATINYAPIACYGGSTRVQVTTMGGTPPRFVTVDNQGPDDVLATTLIFEVSAGTHTFLIADGNGCRVEETVTITQPEPLTVSTTQTNVSIFGGSNGTATATAAGGTAPYTYSWNTNPVQTGATATGLAAGSYTVTVTDKNGCTASRSVTITQPPRG